MTVHYLPGCSPHDPCPPRAILTQVAPDRLILDLEGSWQVDDLGAAEAFAKAILKIIQKNRRARKGR